MCIRLEIPDVFKYLIFIIGRQEKKVVSERRREIKRLKSEQETVSYWKVRFREIMRKIVASIGTKDDSILLEKYMDICCCVISGFYYLYFIYVLFGSQRLNI